MFENQFLRNALKNRDLFKVGRMEDVTKIFRKFYKLGSRAA